MGSIFLKVFLEILSKSNFFKFSPRKVAKVGSISLEAFLGFLSKSNFLNFIFSPDQEKSLRWGRFFLKCFWKFCQNQISSRFAQEKSLKPQWDRLVLKCFWKFYRNQISSSFVQERSRKWDRFFPKMLLGVLSKSNFFKFRPRKIAKAGSTFFEVLFEVLSKSNLFKLFQVFGCILSTQIRKTFGGKLTPTIRKNR
jgi:hypothetical protein